MRLGQDVPEALQTGPHRPLLDGAVVALIAPPARLCNQTFTASETDIQQANTEHYGAQEERKLIIR